MLPLKVVIVEDEVNNVLLIREMLKKLNFPTEVVGVASEVNEAVDVISNTSPQLVLLDIMIKGGTSFTVLEKLGNYRFEIIFITAYNQFALDAIKKQTLDYILKPINTEEFILALENCKKKLDEKSKIDLLQSEAKQHFQIKTHGGTEIILLSEIIYFSAEGSYTKCVTEKNSMIVSKNIGELEAELPTNRFFRCHHSFIINTQHIQKIEFGRSGTITCTGKNEVPVSQRKKKEFIDFLNKHYIL
jgi:two-component system LytT family response regulator